MTKAKRIQQAIDFLANLSKGDVSGLSSDGLCFDGLSEAACEDRLLKYAEALGYGLDAESISEAFRLRMLARELAHRQSTRS